MKYLLALVAMAGCGGVAFLSVIFGALMLTSANGPTTGNWIAHYVLVYAVPIIIILLCIYTVMRIVR